MQNVKYRQRHEVPVNFPYWDGHRFMVRGASETSDRPLNSVLARGRRKHMPLERRASTFQGKRERETNGTG